MRILLLAVLLLAQVAAHAAHLLVVTTSPVTPGKFRNLAELAQPYGITVEARFIERLAQPVDDRFWQGADLVLFDAPRDHIEQAVREKIAPVLPVLTESGVPVIWMHSQKPRWQALPDRLGKRLADYYNNGGAENNRGFVATLSAHLAGNPWDSLAGVSPPVVFPEAAIYHPKAPNTVFANTASYLAWKEHKAGTPVVAIAFHQQAIAAGQTGLINDFIARIEASGATALAFYSPVMDNSSITRLLAPDGKALAQVLINTQIMLNPEGRRGEFEKLGIPVIQAMQYKKGDASDFAADPAGISLMDVPFYLSQPEFAGIHDVMVASVTDAKSEQLVPIPAQSAAVVDKALNLAALALKKNAQKRVAIMFWNYPAGEKNLGASFMNLPNSLSRTLSALKDEGYLTQTPDAATLTQQLQRLLRPFYRPVNELPAEMAELENDGLAEAMPLAEYRQWLDAQPEPFRKAWLEAVGKPGQSAFVIRRHGEEYFVIPRLKLGNVVILPQPPRGEPDSGSLYARNKEIYHSSTAAPTHYYQATYLWLRRGFEADVLIHFGTHGTQEWLPGKERGLSVTDYPLQALGDLPVIYPYIVDNIGEAVQTKRRGRAVNISHQTAPFTPAGLHDAFTKLHDELHAWLAQDDGAVKDKIRDDLIAQVMKDGVHKDMGWSEERMRRDFRLFIDALHDHLHELAQSAQPKGLHTFGLGPDERWRLTTVLMMLGSPFWEAVATHVDGNANNADEAIIADYEKIPATVPYQWLKRHIVDGQPTEGLPDPLREQIEQGRRWYADLDANSEMNGLLAALGGRYVPTSYGGDPIKNPDALPTGRNLYGFDPSRVPTKAAWAAGKEAFNKLIAAHKQKTGSYPDKLTFSLWSVETMRHQGMLEAQALWALGVEPVWDAGGRVVDVKLVPRAELGRARVDVVLSATGLYRDHFPNTMKQLARAAQLAAEAGDEPDNRVAENSRTIVAALVKEGWNRAAAGRAGATRIFSAESGSYGSGLDDAALATDTWTGKEEADRKMAELYLRKMQFAFGPDEADWGKSGDTLAKEAGASASGSNLYAAHLKGTQGAVLSRTSNLYGMLTTDDPFQYLGGIATAVRYLDGKAPELFISNLRGSGSGKAESADNFLAKELQTRQFHPGYIKNLMAEGYSGSLEMVDSANNLTGWTTVAHEIVRDDQWQQYAEVYVKDKYNLGLKEWFEENNPHAQAQMIERMLEMERQGYWKSDKETVEMLKSRYRELAERYDVRTTNTTFQQYVGMPGYGLGKPVVQPSKQSEPAKPQPAEAVQPPLQQATPDTTVRGMQLDKVEEQVADALNALAITAMVLLLLLPLGGALRQWRYA